MIICEIVLHAVAPLPKGILANPTTLGEKFKKIRVERKLSRDKAAELLGVSKSIIYKWEHGEGLPWQGKDNYRKLINFIN